MGGWSKLCVQAVQAGCMAQASPVSAGGEHSRFDWPAMNDWMENTVTQMNTDGMPGADGAGEAENPVYRYCWMPTLHLEPGMVIARPVFGRLGRQLAIHLGVGTVLTAATIDQLLNKGVECVAVDNPVPRDEAAYAQAQAAHEARLREIFGAVPTESCAPLFLALLDGGPSEC